MELVEILDEKGNLTGIVKTKKQAHEQGLWHRVAHVWIYNSKGQILLQKRSWQKESLPGLFDVAAAGHVLAGESVEAAALRELHEELGIQTQEKDLNKLGIRKMCYPLLELGYQIREFYHIFCLKHDDFSKLKLQEEEVDKVKLIFPDELEADIKDPIKSREYVPHYPYQLTVIKKIREISRL